MQSVSNPSQGVQAYGTKVMETYALMDNGSEVTLCHEDGPICGQKEDQLCSVNFTSLKDDSIREIEFCQDEDLNTMKTPNCVVNVKDEGYVLGG